MARTELRDTLWIDAEPVLTRIHRWHKGMPQYTLGHLDRLAAIEARLEQHPRLALAGAAYRGVGIPDCIASGEAAAERVLQARKITV
jgi:oxygen-dependent protoporphyrinogen oxidase